METNDRLLIGLKITILDLYVSTLTEKNFCKNYKMFIDFKF